MRPNSSTPLLLSHRISILPWLAVAAIGCLLIVGCGPRRPAMAPVAGKVLYNGQPLEFGSVMFQPESGAPAKAQIQSDGTFTLWTYTPGDGAAIGTHRVRVACFSGQRPGQQDETVEELALGSPLIPERYNNFDESGITIEVVAGKNDVLIELTD
jgi:hypothetical protein